MVDGKMVRPLGKVTCSILAVPSMPASRSLAMTWLRSGATSHMPGTHLPVRHRDWTMLGHQYKHVLNSGLRGWALCAVPMLFAALSVALPADALAQQASGATEGDVISLDEIQVTARKIEENLRDVPFSITAVTRRELQDSNIHNTQELYRWVPNFNFTESGLGFSNLLNIRGIGSSSAVISSAVNYYVDGIPVPTRVFDQRFLDVSQIEVLRGPQGTLFGLNAQAGAVTISTGNPTQSFEGMVGGEIGSNGMRQATAMVSGPVNDRLAMRMSGQLYGYDGDIDNYLFAPTGAIASIDKSVREERMGAVSAKLLLTPDDDTTIQLSAHYRKDRAHPTTGVLLDDPLYPRQAMNPIADNKTETGGFGLTITHDMGWAKLTSISGFYGYDINMDADIVDGFIANAQTGFPPYFAQMAGVNMRAIDEHNSQWTQEVRLDGETASGIRWVSGASAYYSLYQITTDITAMAMANGAYTASVDTLNVAGFGEVTVPLTGKLSWIGGLRATHENKSFNGVFAGRPGAVLALPFFAESGDQNYDFITGRTGLVYDLTSTFSAYATVARGEKPGGYSIYNQFAAFGVASTPYGSAETWSYEVGVRGRPFSEHFEMGMSAFYNDTRDEQLFTYNPVSSRFDIQNADTRTYGGELEARLRPFESLLITGTLALLNTEITSAANSRIVGNEVPYAPSVTASLAAEYRLPLTLGSHSGSAFLRGEYQYVGSRTIDPANSRDLDAYSLINLRTGWESQSFDMYAYVENLADETYTLSAYQAGTNMLTGAAVYAGVPGKSRSFGGGARVRF